MSDQVFPIKLELTGVDSGSLEKAMCKIHEAAYLLTGATGLDLQGPANQQGDAQAAFEQGSFVVPPRCVESRFHGPVIAGEDHDSVVCGSDGVESLEYSADGSVEIFHHLDVGLSVAGGPFLSRRHAAIVAWSTP